MPGAVGLVGNVGLNKTGAEDSGADSALFRFSFDTWDTAFQDAGRTIPITTDGQLIAGVTDQSANGRHLSIGTYAAQVGPEADTAPGGRAMRTAGTQDNCISITDSAFISLFDDPLFDFDLSMRVHVENLSSIGYFFALGNVLSNTVNFWTFGVTTLGAIQSSQVGNVAGTTSVQTANSLIAGGNDYLIRIRVQDAFLTIDLDGVTVYGPTLISTVARTFDRLTLGARGRTTLTSPFRGAIYSAVMQPL